MEFLANNLFLVLIGLILWPRLLLLYTGLVPSASIPPLFGFTLVPRLYLAFTLSAFWDANPFFVVVCWIAAIILDVTALVVKYNMLRGMREAQAETLAYLTGPLS